jgi:hypothetical protein
MVWTIRYILSVRLSGCHVMTTGSTEHYCNSTFPWPLWWGEGGQENRLTEHRQRPRPRPTPQQKQAQSAHAQLSFAHLSPQKLSFGGCYNPYLGLARRKWLNCSFYIYLPVSRVFVMPLEGFFYTRSQWYSRCGGYLVILIFGSSHDVLAFYWWWYVWCGPGRGGYFILWQRGEGLM